MYVDIVISNAFNLNKLFFFLFFLVPGKMPPARGTAAYIQDGYGVFRQPKYECGCCEMLVFMMCGVIQNLYVFNLCRNPDLDDRIDDC